MAARGDPLPFAPLAWACAALAGGVLLHLDRVPPWAALTCLGLITWRLTLARRGRWLPGGIARALLALGMAGVVLVRFHTLNGLAAGTTLLLLMAALKLLETRQVRDEAVLVGAAFFLLLAACLDRQQLARAPLYLAQGWLCCAALAVLAAPALSVRRALLLAARALLFAAPLALAMFLFFPRMPGSFWAIPRGNVARTGLSDSMTPGGIQQLAVDYDVAFRARFDAAPPPVPALYWRGPVLHDFDGRTWRRADALRPGVPLVFLGTPQRYRVALEPTQRPYWFALDTPAHSPAASVTLTADYQLLSSEPVTEPVAYEAVSYLQTRAGAPLGAGARRQDLALPSGPNPRARALAQELRARAGTDAAFASAALDYLRRGGFSYTLDPQPLGADAVDDLLFRTREGFCGHYASAYVTLMRAAGVPARVVTGYLGGEWNPIGRYFEVRQADAHAWAEVWLEGRGWTRIDPTAVVAPERLTRGMMQLMPQAYPASERLLHGAAWLTVLLQRWDAANAWWSEHVVKFDYSSQLDLLARLGFRTPDASYLGWGFTAALLAWLAFIALGNARLSRSHGDALARAYLRLCRKLARVGPARLPHQGPLAYCESVLAVRPDLRATLEALSQRYAQLRYGPAAGEPRGVAEFVRAVRALRLAA